MATKLGMNCKAYFTANPLASADAAGVGLLTFTLMGNITNVTLNLETGESDVTVRANNGWRATEATLKDGSVEFEMIWNDSDTAFTAIKNKWADPQTVDLTCMFLTGSEDTVGEEGLVSEFSVTNFTRDESLEEAVKVSVTLKPKANTFWYVVPTP